MPATILRGDEGYMKVVNTGTKDITGQPGEVLVRADSCDVLPATSQVSQPLTSLPANLVLHTSLVNNTIGGVAIDKIKTGPLNDTEHKNLIDLLLQYNDCFAKGTQDLGCTKLLQMKIKLNTQQPVYRQPHRLSHSEQNIVNSKVNELLEAGIVKESESDFASPVLLVKKRTAITGSVLIIGRLTLLQLKIGFHCRTLMIKSPNLLVNSISLASI